jgi:predicted protein tyrosine phosphatase
MYVFLDIDGVLVKEDITPIEDIELLEADYGKFDPSCLQEFENVIRQHPEVKIVISSAWREAFSLEEIKSRFSNDIAARIRGVTPLARFVRKFFRHQEILEYLKKNNATEELWIAVDDFAEHFPPGTPLVVTNRYRGFDRSSAQKLTALIIDAQSQSNQEILPDNAVLFVSPNGTVKRLATEITATILAESKLLTTEIVLFRQQGKLYYLSNKPRVDGSRLLDILNLKPN